MRIAPLRQLRNDQGGMTKLWTAIILVAFVLVAAAIIIPATTKFSSSGESAALVSEAEARRTAENIAAAMEAAPAPAGRTAARAPTPAGDTDAQATRAAGNTDAQATRGPASVGSTPAPVPRPPSSAGATELEAARAPLLEEETDAETLSRRPGPGETRDSLAARSPVPTSPAATRAPAALQQPQTATVRAGVTDDNLEWDDYLGYRQGYLANGVGYGGQAKYMDVTERYVISAVDVNGMPILDAKVTVWDGQTELWASRTFATGQTLFHPLALGASQAQSFTVSVRKGDFAYTFNLPRGQETNWEARLEQYTVKPRSANLDILFLLDATGSMGDEIKSLQSSLLSIAARIDALQPRPNLRFGLVWYRDRGDAFVVKEASFTFDVPAFSQTLNAIRAEGGGDIPESLNEALHVAIQQMDWRGEDTVRLIFLVADAPPHLDYPQDYDYSQEIIVASKNGVKINPIAASGTDDQAEFVFRQLAQFTQGKFIFLTYDGPAIGTPGDVRTELKVSGYGVQDLDDLVVRLVREEMAHQGW